MSRLRNGRCHGQSSKVAIDVGKEVRYPRRRREDQGGPSTRLPGEMLEMFIGRAGVYWTYIFSPHLSNDSSISEPDQKRGPTIVLQTR